MPIKYAEITIVRNVEEETWFSYFKNLMGHEDIITNNDTIIISFDDGSVSDTKDKLTDKQFKFGPKAYYQNCPIYFNKLDKHTIFLKHPEIKDGNLKIDFKPIFKDYKNFNTSKKEPSIYNAIYEDMCYGELLSVVKNGYNHRYFLAYDDSYFDKSDINYFVNILFTNSFTYEIRDNIKSI
jgi:hypothetical protein